MLALVLLIVTAVSGQSTPPPKCCVARQFEVNMGETGGMLLNHEGKEVPVLVDADNVMHYDYYNRTMVVEVNSHHPNTSATTYTRIIQDFKTRTQYVYGSGGCTTSRTRRHFREPCIPDHATYLGRTTIGYGVNSIQIDSWQYPEPDSSNDIKLAVTTESCVPVIEALIGVVNGAPSELTFLLTNFKPGMRKTSVFQLPDLCKNANDVVENEDQPLHIQRAIKAMETMISH